MTNGSRRGWGVSVTPRPLFTPGKDPVPIVQEAGWAPGPVWTGAENFAPPPPRDSIPVPLLHLWAVRSIQSLSACTRLHFNFTFIVSRNVASHLPHYKVSHSHKETAILIFMSNPAKLHVVLNFQIIKKTGIEQVLKLNKQRRCIDF